MADNPNSAGEGTAPVHERPEGDETQSLHAIISEAHDKMDTGDDGAAPPEGGAGGEGGDAAGATATGEEGTKPGEEGGEQPEPMEAPANWAITDRDMFAKQTPEAQKWLLARYKGMESAHTRRSQEIAPMRGLVERWDPYFKQLNTPAPQAIDLLLQTEYQLRNGSNDAKVQILKRLVTDYGITAPGAAAQQQATGNGQANGQAGPVNDPRYDALAQQFQQLQEERFQEQQSSHQMRAQQLVQQVQIFETETDANGKLTHPFYGEVRTDMARMAQADEAAGIQPELKNLYERAVWANPVTRQKMQSAEAGRVEAERKEKAAKARKAGSSISGAGAPVTEQPKGLRESLEAGWDAAVRA